MPITDELKNLNRLEQAGFTHDQAKAIVEIHEEGLQHGFERFVQVLDVKLEQVRADMRDLEARLRAEIQSVRLEMQSIRAELIKEQRDQMLRFAALVTLIVAVIGGVYRFF